MERCAEAFYIHYIHRLITIAQMCLWKTLSNAFMGVSGDTTSE